MNRRVSPLGTATLMACVLAVGAALAGCSDDSPSAKSSSSSRASTSASASASESASASGSAAPSGGAAAPAPTTNYTPPGGGAAPSVAVTAAAQGAGSPACTALSTVLANVGTIGNKAYSGTVEQADVDRAFGGTALAGVPADAMPYVEAVKVVAEKFPGRDAVAASTLFMDWDPAYNGLVATVTKVCS